MRVLFTKIADARHRVQVLREDGFSETVELETRSFLLHDLAHYAVEAEARLERGFYGLLAAGVSLERLNDRDQEPVDEQLMLAERLAAPMQSVFRQRLSRERYLQQAQGLGVDFVCEAFVDAVLERLRHLTGHWKATPYRAPMQLDWPPDS
ncbi:MAG: hypothetical protein OEZ06_10875 [Myxococcales bacterium]|nr:hypothetical protein [Myxococcales bacterium]